MIPYAAKTHPGLKRGKNEDNYVAEPDMGLFVVADGVGGHTNGEVASDIACKVIVDQVRSGATLTDAISAAHSEVLAEIQARDAESNMGTTVVALHMHGSSYDIAWVGDSRAYLFDGKLRQLTKDHSAINELLDRGVLTPDKIADHPQRHALSRSLGVSDLNTSRASAISGSLRPGQQMLLCSDGLTDELSDGLIQRELKKNGDLDKQVDALVSSALEHGGSDNLTVVLVGVPSGANVSTPSRANLETTQNLGEPAVHVRKRKSGFLRYLWIPLVALAVAALTYFRP